MTTHRYTRPTTYTPASQQARERQNAIDDAYDILTNLIPQHKLDDGGITRCYVTRTEVEIWIARYQTLRTHNV